MKNNQNLIEDYEKLLLKFYSKDDAINIIVQNTLESTEYRELKDDIWENYIKTLLKNI